MGIPIKLSFTNPTNGYLVNYWDYYANYFLQRDGPSWSFDMVMDLAQTDGEMVVNVA